METVNEKSSRLCNTLHVSLNYGIAGHEVASALDRDWGIAVSTGIRVATGKMA